MATKKRIASRPRKRAKKKSEYTVSTQSLGIALASLLFVYGVSVIPAGVFVYNMQAFSAAVVGASASVPPNPDNTALQQLQEKERTLNQRADDLNRLQQQLNERDSESIAVAWASLYGSIILFVLIGLNFYMDMRRRRDPRAAPGSFLVDLKKI